MFGARFGWLTSAVVGLSGPGILSLATAGVIATDLVVTFKTNFDLSLGVAGFAYSIGVGAPVAVWYDIPGGALGTQTVTVPYADLGAVAGDTINVDAGYSVESPAAVKVYGSALNIAVLSVVA